MLSRSTQNNGQRGQLGTRGRARQTPIYAQETTHLHGKRLGSNGNLRSKAPLAESGPQRAPRSWRSSLSPRFVPPDRVHVPEGLAFTDMASDRQTNRAIPSEDRVFRSERRVADSFCRRSSETRYTVVVERRRTSIVGLAGYASPTSDPNAVTTARRLTWRACSTPRRD